MKFVVEISGSVDIMEDDTLPMTDEERAAMIKKLTAKLRGHLESTVGTNTFEPITWLLP